jgi:chemotaxis protein MotB
VRPLVDNRTAENREKNRRVEIIIVKSAPKDNDDEPELNSENSGFDDQLNATPEDFGLDPDEIF